MEGPPLVLFRQYIRGKWHKYGIKIYSLREPGGLCIMFIVYSGKGGVLGGQGHAAQTEYRSCPIR